MIIELDQVGRGDVGRVGGKGASLGELLRAGVPLPGGFVIEAAAYRAAVAAADAWPAIEAALSARGVASGEADACEAAAAMIREVFLRVPLGALEVPLRARVDGIGQVAVRSSATAEDLPDASFAGQQETFLGVLGADAICEAVRRCWASLWTARSISYRARQGFDHAEVALAVVVQEMVEPLVAGVLFTRDPVGGRADELLLNASWGLGESVVSGVVTPDSWRLGRAGALVRELRVGSKETRIVARAGGGTVTEPVPEALRARACLDAPALRALVSLGERVEALYGAPQDLEFAWTGTELFLLQSRPITTRAQPAARLSRAQRRVLDDILEHYPTAPLPIDEAPVVEGYEALQEMLRAAGLALPHAREVLCMDADGVTRVLPPPTRPTSRLLALPATLKAAWARDPDAWLEAVAAPRAEILSREPRALDDAALAVQLRGALDLAALTGRVRFTDVIAPMSLRGAWLGALSRLARLPVQPTGWLGGLSYRTLEIELALQRVADAILDRPAVLELYLSTAPDEVRDALATAPGGPDVAHLVDELLAEHGARAAGAYVPFSTRSWREDRGPLHAALAVMVRTGERGAAGRRAEAAAARHVELRARVRERLPAALRGTFDRTLSAYRRAHVAREASLYAIEEAFAAARGAVDELAIRLTTRGALGAPSHAAYARVDELIAALDGDSADLRQVVARRRARRELAVSTWRAQRRPPSRRGGAVVAGAAGSPGLAEGPVRILRSIGEFPSLGAGDVLVCPHTDPTWTPLFGLAAAVVADTGGPLSHAAIVAREYGIPAVLGTGTGTTTLRDGDWVIVDGSSGEVHAGRA